MLGSNVMRPHLHMRSHPAMTNAAAPQAPVASLLMLTEPPHGSRYLRATAHGPSYKQSYSTLPAVGPPVCSPGARCTSPAH